MLDEAAQIRQEAVKSKVPETAFEELEPRARKVNEDLEAVSAILKRGELLEAQRRRGRGQDRGRGPARAIPHGGGSLAGRAPEGPRADAGEARGQDAAAQALATPARVSTPLQPPVPVVPLPPPAMRGMVGPTDPRFFDNPGGGPIYAGFGLPLEAYESVFDFGCGCGRQARQLLQQTPRPRRYVGIDTNREMVEWCRANLTPVDPAFQFRHHDVYSPSYAPENSIRPGRAVPGGGRRVQPRARPLRVHASHPGPGRLLPARGRADPRSGRPRLHELVLLRPEELPFPGRGPELPLRRRERSQRSGDLRPRVGPRGREARGAPRLADRSAARRRPPVDGVPGPALARLGGQLPAGRGGRGVAVRRDREAHGRAEGRDRGGCRHSGHHGKPHGRQRRRPCAVPPQPRWPDPPALVRAARGAGGGAARMGRPPLAAGQGPSPAGCGASGSAAQSDAASHSPSNRISTSPIWRTCAALGPLDLERSRRRRRRARVGRPRPFRIAATAALAAPVPEARVGPTPRSQKRTRSSSGADTVTNSTFVLRGKNGCDSRAGPSAADQRVVGDRLQEDRAVRVPEGGGRHAARARPRPRAGGRRPDAAAGERHRDRAALQDRRAEVGGHAEAAAAQGLDLDLAAGPARVCTTCRGAQPIRAHREGRQAADAVARDLGVAAVGVDEPHADGAADGSDAYSRTPSPPMPTCRSHSRRAQAEASAGQSPLVHQDEVVAQAVRLGEGSARHGFFLPLIRASAAAGTWPRSRPVSSLKPGGQPVLPAVGRAVDRRGRWPRRPPRRSPEPREEDPARASRRPGRPSAASTSAPGPRCGRGRGRVHA